MITNVIEDFGHIFCALFSETTEVVQYSYRSAQVVHRLLDFERDREVETQLAEKAGKQIDNHTLYELKCADGHSFVIKCFDDHMTLGLGVIERCW